jgi:predicted ester cyclase
MSEEKNKALLRRYYEECWNKGNLALIEECFSSPILMGGTPVDLDLPREGMMRWLTGFPDLQFVVEQMVAEGDIVAANTRFVGTHRGIFHWGDLGPWEPTGKSINVREMHFFRLAGGKVVELWFAWDRTGFLQQLGVADPVPTGTTR